MPDLDEIIPNLFLGNINAGWNPETLHQFNIHAVLQLLPQTPPPDVIHIPRLIIHIEDYPETNIKKFFHQTFQWIDNHLLNHQTVLIHCYAGVSRSATIVIAYLMNKNKWNYQQSFDFVLARRPCIEPNWGFTLQLYQYENLIDFASSYHDENASNYYNTSHTFPWLDEEDQNDHTHSLDDPSCSKTTIDSPNRTDYDNTNNINPSHNELDDDARKTNSASNDDDSLDLTK